MWEGVLIGTGLELGKQVLKQVLDLGQSALEGYVEDFFKDCLDSGVARLQTSSLKGPMAEAIGCFIQRFVEELQINEIPETSLDHYYKATIKQFVRDKAVGQILGKAFETDCKQIDYKQLEQLWLQQVKPGWQFPAEEFDWRRVAKSYVLAVQGIVKADAELRELLSLDLAEQRTASLKQLAGLSVGFNLSSYREAILEQYESLKLESLGSSNYEREGTNYRNVSLWEMFVAQDVRDCQDYFPQIYELPKEHLKRLQQAGEVDEEALEEDTNIRRERYRQQISQPVLAVLGADGKSSAIQPSKPYLVILGDPGSGKSTLLRYLAVRWALQPAGEQIPLLIELRGYSQSRTNNECQNFIEFIHKGSNWISHLDQHQLDEWLRQGKAIVMLDGLDEVADRQQRGTVLNQIHDFTQDYPQVPVIVTSRIIGYSAQRLRDVGFQHFMLQDLTEAQIESFIQCWHDLTYADGAEKQRKRERLHRAVQDSRAIRELAGNPLLLTLMAILNRGEELPRDRSRLYEKASEVLLYQWDWEEKLLKDPRLEKYSIEINHDDKQKMLRRIAAFMQNSNRGLAGNFIRRDDLQHCVTEYLKTVKEAPNAPSIATIMIDQLRERNFILCSLGGDAYAFVHRTFLEYFCATEIKERFDKRGVSNGLTFEQLRDEVFSQHWQDETWHEVLKLVVGLIDAQFAGRLIQWLMQQQINRLKFIENERLQKQGVTNLLLAADCLGEVRDRSTVGTVANQLLQQLQKEVEQEYPFLQYDAAEAILSAIAAHWPEKPEIWLWLEQCTKLSTQSYIPESAVNTIAKARANQPKTCTWLKERAQSDEYWAVRRAAVQALAQGWKDDPDTLPILKERAQSDEDGDVRHAAVQALAQGGKDDEDTLPILKERAQSDEDEDIRHAAVQALAQGGKDDEDTLPWLKERAQRDKNWDVRHAAVQALAQGWKHLPELFDFFQTVVLSDPFERKYSWQNNPRQTALEACTASRPDQPKTLELLRDRAANDPDEQLRSWAQEKLESLKAKTRNTEV